MIKNISWKDIEYFNPIWKERIINMAIVIPPECKTVMDIGCGMMWLKEFLSNNTLYIPVDYTNRGEGTIICDFNKQEFPDQYVDCCFVSGCIEYIHDYEWLIKKICTHANYCVLSYCTLNNFPDVNIRRTYAWVNHLTESHIIKMFNNNNLLLIQKINTNNVIFLFKKAQS